MNPQEYLVTDANKVSSFVEANIGVEYEINDSTNITVFDLTMEEHTSIVEFITDNNLWSE